MLRLAAGKSAGMVAAWQSGALDSAGNLARQGAAFSGQAWTGNAHGSMTVTAVAWSAAAQTAGAAGAAQQQQQALLCTTCMDGSAKAWHWDGRQVCRPSEVA